MKTLKLYEITLTVSYDYIDIGEVSLKVNKLYPLRYNEQILKQVDYIQCPDGRIHIFRIYANNKNHALAKAMLLYGKCIEDKRFT